MMKRILLVALLMLAGQTAGMAQNIEKLWKKVRTEEKLHPRDALETVEIIADKALKKKDYGELLRAELYRQWKMVELSTDSVPQQVALLKDKEREARNADAVLSAVYSTVLSALAVNDTTSYARLALANPDLLARVKVRASTYRAITGDYFAGKYLGHDLLSIIARFMGNYRLLAERYAKNGNREAAFLVDFEQIEKDKPIGKNTAYVRQYVARLDSLGRAYSDIELSAETEIAALIALENAKIPSDSLLSRCEAAVRKWKGYARMGKVKEIIDEMTRSHISINDWGVFPVSAENRLLVMHKNISELKMRISRVKEKKIVWDEIELDDDDDLEIISKRAVRKHTEVVKLPNDNRLLTRKTPVGLPHLPAGCYLLELTTKPATEMMRAVFFVSDSRPIIIPLPGDSVRVAVVDAMTSRPVTNAAISYPGGRSFKLDTAGETRIAINDTTPDVLLLRSTKGTENIIHIDEVSMFDKTRQSAETNTNIMLDRKIYRPGETVRVGIIRHRNKGWNMRAVAGEKITVGLLDANFWKIDTLVVRTDSFGTAGASFVLPERMLNGRHSVVAGGVSADFSVENYKRPTFDVVVKKPANKFALGDSVVVRGLACTITGEPVRGATVVYALNNAQRQDSLLTDSAGFFAIKIFLGGSSDPADFRVGGHVTDNAGEQEDFQCMFRASRKRVRLETNVWGRFTERSSLPGIRFFLANWAARPVDGEAEYWFEGYEHLRRKAKCNADEPLLVPDGIPDGLWNLTAVCEGDTLRRSLIVFSDNIARPCVDTPSWFHQSRKDFGPDDSLPVTLQVGTSRRNVHVVYSICNSSRILEEGTFEMSDTIVRRELRYKPEYADGINVYYAWCVDGKFFDREFEIERRLPENKLNLTWETFRDKLVPGSDETWRLNITDSAGRPVDAQVMATLYDTAFDRLEANEWNFRNGLNVSMPLIYCTSQKYLLGSTIIFHEWASLESHYYPALSSVSLGAGIMKGVVTDEQGNPVIGASVVIHNRPWLGTVTDADGRYTIRVTPGDKVQFSYVGMQSVVVPVVSWRKDVVMKESNYELQEVVATGVGTTRKSYSASAVLTALEGRAVGISVRGVSLYGSRSRDDDQLLSPGPIIPELPELKRISNLPVRKNLTTTAFFFPQLSTDDKGRVTLRFRLPESVTTWRFIALAHTPDMRSGMLKTLAVAKKPMMIQPNMPRFVRVGDAATISCRVLNLSEKNLSGKATIILLEPGTERVVHTETKLFSVDSDATGQLQFTHRLRPGTPPLLICKIVAEAGGTTDGEQHYLPVVSENEVVMRSEPFLLSGSAKTKRISLGKLIPERIEKVAGFPRLTIEYADNPAALMLGALHEYAHPLDDCAICQAMAYYSLRLGRNIIARSPALEGLLRRHDSLPAQSPEKQSALLRNEEMKNVMPDESPWMAAAKAETSALQQLTVFMPGSPLDGKEASLLRKLTALQKQDGSWAWMEGMHGSREVTKTVALLLLRLNRLIGEQSETRPMLDKALQYLSKGDITPYELYLMALDNRKDNKKARKILATLRAGLSQLNIHALAQAAVLFHNYADEHTASEIVRSLKQYTVKAPDGSRFYDTRRAPDSWFDYKIPSHVAAIEAIKLITPADTATIREMLMWLFREKQTQRWSTPLQSADALFAFFSSMPLTEPSTAPAATILIDGKPIAPTTSAFTSALGYRKETILYSRQRNIEIHSPAGRTAWGAVYAQFVQKTADVQSSSAQLHLERRIIPRQPGPLRVGSRVRVQIKITAERDLDFVQIADHRAACFESVDKHSGYRYSGNLGYYCDRKSHRTTFFISRLSKGTHILEEEYYLDRPGTYSTGLLTAQCAYYPSIAATLPPARITVR